MAPKRVELIQVGDELYKSCPKCKSSLPMAEFGRDKSTPTGYCSRCKRCIARYVKQPHVRSKLRKYAEDYAHKYPDKIKKYSNNYRQKCSDVLNKKRRDYHWEHRDEQLQYMREYKTKNINKLREDSRKYYADNINKKHEYDKKRYDKERGDARRAARAAIKCGKLIRPDNCEMKDTSCLGGITAHHDDYAKPLDVRWLCVSHHRRLHYKIQPRRCIYSDSRRKQNAQTQQE